MISYGVRDSWRGNRGLSLAPFMMHSAPLVLTPYNTTFYFTLVSAEVRSDRTAALNPYVKR